MTKKIIFCLILALFVPVLFAQQPGFADPGETILESYERIFIRSSLNTKVNVLSDAANDEMADVFYGPLCGIALHFVNTNASLFRDDPDMISVTVAAVRGVGKYAYSPAGEALWQGFLRFPDRVIRYEVLKVLQIIDTRSINSKINDFLADQNRRHRSGMLPDSEVLSSLFDVLGRTGDDSSYSVLFDSIILYSGKLEEDAVRAFYEIDGNLFDFCMGKILDGNSTEKLTAFGLAAAREKISAEKKGSLAEAALDVALSLPGDRRSEIQELAENSLFLIREAGWIRALPQVVKYYNQSLAAFRADFSRKQPLINAIKCLGNLKSAEAAQSLALQLSLFNSRSAALQTEELEVVLALIHALGQLGYKASYDGLHYASILDYPGIIKEAARNALTALKW